MTKPYKEIMRFNSMGHRRPDGDIVLYEDYVLIHNEFVDEIKQLKEAYDKLDDANIKYYEENKKLKKENERLATNLISLSVEHPCYQLSKKLESELAESKKQAQELIDIALDYKAFLKSRNISSTIEIDIDSALSKHKIMENK